jgi:hypothetical protein
MLLEMEILHYFLQTLTSAEKRIRYANEDEDKPVNINL